MNLLQILYPPKCIFCQKILEPFHKDEDRDLICPECFEKAPFINDGCKRCGAPPDGGLCQCANEGYSFTQNISLFVYDDIVRESVHLLKYKGKKGIGIEFGKLFMKYANFPGHFFEDIDIITTVPIHKKRKQKRGYNQVDLIAKEISKSSGVSLDTNLLIRTINTPPMHNLSVKQRKENLEKAFIINDHKNVNYKTILLIDDIFTTGSTIEECSKTLLRNGAKKIFSITMTKTIKKPNIVRAI